MSELLPGPKYFDGMCLRMTGWTLENWNNVHRKRRSEDVRRKRIETGRPLDHARMIELSTMYGFEDDDFYCRLVDVSEVQRQDMSFQPSASSSGRFPDRVIRWYLKPDAIPSVL